MPIVKEKATRRHRNQSQRHSSPTGLTAFFATAAASLSAKNAAFTVRLPHAIVAAISAEPEKVKPLLAGYGKAMAKSQAEGRPMSFRVEVFPTGRAAISDLEEPAEQIPDELAAALDRARERGRTYAAEILETDDMLSADEFAALLGTTRMTVNTRRKNCQLLGLDGARRGFRFPAWQVDKNGKPFAALPQLFELLGGGPWSVYRFLVQPHPELDGMTGREALRRGKTGEALAVADSIARGDFV
ncbi:MAG: XRE family transcriptional regulator [Alphaproteobacteria bacterium]|nr:XRE family transcriptional regulator [Alphaproteobacteria bacterium]